MNELAKVNLLQQRIDRRREIMQAGITSWHAVLTDEYMDAMAERFIRMRIRELARITFEQYLECPDWAEMYVNELLSGNALQGDSRKPGCLIVLNGGKAGRTIEPLH